MNDLTFKTTEDDQYIQVADRYGTFGAIYYSSDEAGWFYDLNPLKQSYSPAEPFGSSLEAVNAVQRLYDEEIGEARSKMEGFRRHISVVSIPSGGQPK